MNETDFRIECERNHVIVILITKKPSLRMTNSDNREYIIFCQDQHKDKSYKCN